MLTGDLLQFTRRGGKIHPRRVDPDDARLREGADGLIGLFQAHVGLRRGELEAAVRHYAPAGLDPKRVRGLARLLWDRCTVEVASPAEPATVRQALFDAAAEEWKRFPEVGTPEWRAGVVERVAQGLGIHAAQLDDALYADIEENQAISAFDPPAASRLLTRYNVAQVQGLLLRCSRMHITAPWPTPQRLRQMLRYLKFHGLLFTVEATGEGDHRQIALTVDGPLSVLEGATRYGLNLALFFPALLLWPAPWKLEAEIRMKAGGAPDVLAVEPHPGLQSHYPDTGQWVPEEVRAFVDSFNATPGPWRAEAAEDIVTLPGNAYVVPDYLFRHASGSPPVAVEHLLYPNARRLTALLERTQGMAAPRCAFAVRQYNGAPQSSRVYSYRRTLTPAGVREWLDGLLAQLESV